MITNEFYELFRKVTEILNDLDPSGEIYSISFHNGVIRPVIDIVHKPDKKVKVLIGALDQIFIVTENDENTHTSAIQVGDFENKLIEILCSLI